MSTTADGAFANSATRHGTASGYRKHQQLGERPCDPCFQAKREYDARRRSAPDPTVQSRLSARAQGRASTRMRALYPEVWAALYAEEKARIFAEDATS